MTEEEVLSFVRSSIRSVSQLEMLLLLQASPDRTWNSEALDRALRASHAVVGEALRHFLSKGLVVRSGDESFQCQARDNPHNELVQELVALHAIKPFSVLSAIVDG